MTDKTDDQTSASSKNSEKKQPSRLAGLRIALLMLMSLTAGFVGGWAGSEGRLNNFGANSSIQNVISNESQLISEIATEAGQSVVSVNVMRRTGAQSFFGFGQAPESQSAGTGFIIREDGIIVTNRHVIPAGTTRVSVTLSDGTELEDVEVIGRTNAGDPLDVAFLRVTDREGKELKPIKLGDSSKMRVGDRVIAIGNALGQFQNTVTTGILSGYGRSIEAGDIFSSETLQNMFQTDAAINQGNSGGPLLNLNGEVIGINTAVAGGSAEGIGFAIPINDAKGLIDGVLETGQLERPYIGVRYVMLTNDLAAEFDLDIQRGAFIVPEDDGSEPSVLPDSPAAKAGLRAGDVITHVNGQEVNERNSLVSLIGKHRVGDEISLQVVRDGQEQSFDLTLEATP